MRRSLTLRLTLAFLLVGVTGALLVAILFALRTRSEFDRFLSRRDQSTLVSTLSDYYASHQSWDGISDYLLANQNTDFYARRILLTDADGTPILSPPSRQNDTPSTREETSSISTADATPITVEGAVVGYVSFNPPGGPPSGARPPLQPEGDFIQRVSIAAGLSALVAAVIALLLGSFLAQTLTHSIRDLTSATRAMAAGDLEQQVVIRSQDEIGELSLAFNQMAVDLAHASQLRKQMTADLAHDLRTPLSILRGYTEGLQDGRLIGTPEMFATMHGEVTHLQRLVEDLRVLSLADAGELSLHTRAIDPSAVLERTALAYIYQAEANGVTIKVEADPDLPSLELDTDRMTQVLNNLVSNALRYTKENGEIVLSATVEDQQVIIRVSDNGSGIAAEDLPFIFDRFYRADSARQRGNTISSGLGLAIARAIVEAHGGTISATSTAGQGTTMAIRLPIHTALATH